MAKAEKKKKDDEQVEADASSAEVQEIPIGDGKEELTEEPTPDEESIESDPVALLEAKVKELEDQKLRALADLDNYRKRMARQYEDVIRTANDKLLGQILEVVDNFERALAHAAEERESNGELLAALREGTELIYNQMTDFLARHEVKPIESIGRPFDPNYHEAMMQMPSDEYDEGIVVTEISKGYMVGDRVLRHARVAVSRGPVEDQEQEEN
jgi:molecular chaperone GrpE